MKAGAFRKKAATPSFNSPCCASVLQASLVEYNRYYRRGSVQPLWDVDPAIPLARHSAHQEPLRGASPHHISMDLLCVQPFLLTSTHLMEVFFVLCFDYLTALYLQNISRACKRLLCCSVKSCSHQAQSHLWQRACTRPRTAHEHKGSYTCPPCSSL